MKCTEEAIEEGNLFDDMRTTTMTTTMRTMTMNRMMIMMTVFVCVIQPILKQAIAVVVPEARSAIANVAQTDTTGGSSHDHHTFIVSYGGNKSFPLKRAPESKQNEMFSLKRNEKNTIYINESGLYGLMLHSKLESTHVFRFRMAKNLIVFWLLYKYLYIFIYIYICTKKSRE